MVEVKDAYDVKAADAFKKWVDLSFTKMCAYPSTFAVLGDMAGKKLVDFGCGEGGFLRSCAAKNSEELVGYELSSAMLKNAKIADGIEFGSCDRIVYRQADCFTALELPEEHFDFATSHFMISHCASEDGLQHFANNLYKCLKPNGLAIMITIPFYVSNHQQQALIETAFGYRCSIRPVPAIDPAMDASIAMKPNPSETGSRFTDEVFFEFKEYYWRKETLNQCLNQAGFKQIWDAPRVLHSLAEFDAAKKVLELPEKDFYIHVVAKK